MVFCKQCRWCNWIFWGNVHVCRHEKYYIDDYYAPKHDLIENVVCSKKNKNNDCIDFKKK